jgi:hypothetical protein
MNHSLVIGAAALLMLAMHNQPAGAQDCSNFQKAVADTMAVSDNLDAQIKRFKQTSDTPKYDIDVCAAATKLQDQAHAAVGLATAACDPNRLADSMSELQESAESEIPLYCTRDIQTPSRQSPSASGFIFPDSDRRLLTAAEIARLSPVELRIARNEIFARRGRYFKSDDLNQHFGAFAWYRPYTWEPPLNAIERQNAEMLLNAEQRR